MARANPASERRRGGEARLTRVGGRAGGAARQRRDPEPFHGTLATRLLHYPALNQFPLLTCVAAVDHLVSLRDESLQDAKLPHAMLLLDQLDAESWRDHR